MEKLGFSEYKQKKNCKIPECLKNACIPLLVPTNSLAPAARNKMIPATRHCYEKTSSCRIKDEEIQKRYKDSATLDFKLSKRLPLKEKSKFFDMA